MTNSYTLAQLASELGTELRGDPDARVTGLATLQNATSTEVAFLANKRYLPALQHTQAGAVILQPEHDDPNQVTNALLSDDPYLAYARIARLFARAPRQAPEVHPSAVIAADVQLPDSVAVGANAVIESGAVIGANVQIGAGCYLGENVRIGAGTRLWPGVTLYYDVQVGTECCLHAGVVLGADGFGWAVDNGEWVKIPQLGSVVVGDRVDIGANTTIDRGALNDTVIGDGCIIDNLCMIGHNVELGENTAMAGQVGVAGSTRIGKNCLIGGASGINGHIELADGVQLHGMAMVTKSLTEPGVYASGQPALPQSDWAKVGVRQRQLPELFQRIRQLEKYQQNTE